MIYMKHWSQLKISLISPFIIHIQPRSTIQLLSQCDVQVLLLKISVSKKASGTDNLGIGMDIYGQKKVIVLVSENLVKTKVSITVRI